MDDAPVRGSFDGFTLIELLIAVAILGIVVAIAIPNLMNALDKGKQKRSMTDIKAIGTAVEAYAVDNARYPAVANIPTLKLLVDPIFSRDMPLLDGWAHAIQCDSTGSSYTIYSQGKDGTGSVCTPGPTSTFNDEICFSNGRFQRYPDGPQR